MSEAAKGVIPRVLPTLDEVNGYFWTAGETGRLRFLRCTRCQRYAHPPAPTCRACRHHDLEVAEVSGLATVLSFTINRHPWTDEATEPYVVAIVGIDEQPGLHLTTNIVRCDPSDVTIGMRVEVEFLRDGDVWIPLFHPCAEEG